jgi:hypothetical protein
MNSTYILILRLLVLLLEHVKEVLHGDPPPPNPDHDSDQLP